MEIDVRVPFAIHTFYMGRGYTFTSADTSSAGLDVGDLSSDDQIKSAVEQLLGLSQGDLRHFVVDRNNANSVFTFTVRPQERFA